MEDKIKEVGELLKKLKSPNYRTKMGDVREYFALHNEVTDNKKEFNTGCPVCRKRTLNQLKEWYHEQTT